MYGYPSLFRRPLPLAVNLVQVPYSVDVSSCLDACCAVASCQTYQWCPAGATDCNAPGTCWIGSMQDCAPGKGWVSRGRNASAPAPPVPGKCSDPGCEPGTDDSGWRVVNLPHDAVVENDPSPAADKSHGYLPYSKMWYRKHLALPAAAAGSTIWIEVEAAQTASQVYMNGFLLGTHDYGYTPNSYWVNASVANFGGDNVLAIFVDATNPDSWCVRAGGARARLASPRLACDCRRRPRPPRVAGGTTVVEFTAMCG